MRDKVQVIPASAISEEGLIDTTQAEKVTVELGANNSSYVEVTGGLKEGDLVLVAVAGSPAADSEASV